MRPSPCARHPEGRGHILKNTSESLLIYLTTHDTASTARTLVCEGGETLLRLQSSTPHDIKHATR